MRIDISADVGGFLASVAMHELKRKTVNQTFPRLKVTTFHTYVCMSCLKINTFIFPMRYCDVSYYMSLTNLLHLLSFQRKRLARLIYQLHITTNKKEVSDMLPPHTHTHENKKQFKLEQHAPFHALTLQ